MIVCEEKEEFATVAGAVRRGDGDVLGDSAGRAPVGAVVEAVEDVWLDPRGPGYATRSESVLVL